MKYPEIKPFTHQADVQLVESFIENESATDRKDVALDAQAAATTEQRFITPLSLSVVICEQHNKYSALLAKVAGKLDAYTAAVIGHTDAKRYREIETWCNEQRKRLTGHLVEMQKELHRLMDQALRSWEFALMLIPVVFILAELAFDAVGAQGLGWPEQFTALAAFTFVLAKLGAMAGLVKLFSSAIQRRLKWIVTGVIATLLLAWFWYLGRARYEFFVDLAVDDPSGLVGVRPEVYVMFSVFLFAGATLTAHWFWPSTEHLRAHFKRNRLESVIKAKQAEIEDIATVLEVARDMMQQNQRTAFKVIREFRRLSGLTKSLYRRSISVFQDEYLKHRRPNEVVPEHFGNPSIPDLEEPELSNPGANAPEEPVTQHA